MEANNLDDAELKTMAGAIGGLLVYLKETQTLEPNDVEMHLEPVRRIERLRLAVKADIEQRRSNNGQGCQNLDDDAGESYEDADDDELMQLLEPTEA